MPRRNFNDLRAGLVDQVGEARVAEVERAAIERYDAEEKRLADLRRARAYTQTQLASALGVSQAQISRVEKQTDLYLSTLESYLEALGGRLELVAVFDDTGDRVQCSIGALQTPEPSGSEVITDEDDLVVAGGVASKMQDRVHPGNIGGGERVTHKQSTIGNGEGKRRK